MFMVNLCGQFNIESQVKKSLNITDKNNFIFLIVFNRSWILFNKIIKEPSINTLNLHGKNYYDYIREKTNMPYLGIYVERGYVNKSEKRLAIKHLINKSIPSNKIFIKEDVEEKLKDLESQLKKELVKKEKTFELQKEQLKQEFDLKIIKMGKITLIFFLILIFFLK